MRTTVTLRLALALALAGVAAVSTLRCPDGTSECPSNATCCVTPDGAWGCCPMPQASCCEDKVHCCPHATTCDLAHGRCVSPHGDIPLSTKFPAWKSQWRALAPLRQVTCPDGRSACPDGATCCQLPSAQYGCCPLQNAVCCSDGQHCCPQGTTCDLERSMCTSGTLAVTIRLSPVGDVKCDDEMSCPDGNTCCRLSSGAWGCCPLEQAVCCKDHQHCCPRGYTCNAATQSCEKLLAATPLRFPVPAGPPLSPPRPVATIPGDTARACLPGQRCCRSKDGSWARCPFAQGSCCEDGRRCCPAGYRCARRGRECWPQRWDVGGGISSRTLL
uniref:Granulin precursor n=1 Tax=Cairina moschata TaxID=8855 RepID=A0A8C3CQK3_CAIMO